MLNGLIRQRSTDSLNLGLELGRILIAAKDTVRHANKKGFGERGGWRVYVFETIGMNPRTASYYMKGAKGFDNLPQRVKTAIFADFSMRGFAGLLRGIAQHANEQKLQDEDEPPTKKRPEKYVPTGLLGKPLRHCYSLWEEFVEKVTPELRELAEDELQQFGEMITDAVLCWDEED